MDVKSAPASGWRWVVLASSFFSLLLTGYGQNNAGVMKVALLRHMGSDVTTTTWLVSYYSGSFALTAPVGSVLINLVNCRACVVLSGALCLLGYVLSGLVTDVFYLFFTLTLVGIGQGMSNMGSLVILGHYFPDKTAIATGVSIAGGALGVFVHPPLLQALVDWFGLRGAFLLTGAVAFQGSVCGALMRPARLELERTRSKRRGTVLQGICHMINDAISCHMTLLTSWPVLTILLSAFLLTVGLLCLLVRLPSYQIHHNGMSPTAAAFSISVYGIGSFFSRLASGFIAHDARVGNLLLYCGTIGVHTVVTLAAPALMSTGIVGSYAYCFMVGLYSGGPFSLIYPVLYDVVGLHHLSTTFGMVLFTMGVGGLLGAPLSHLIHDDDQNPYLLFGFISAMFGVSAILGSLGTVLPARPMEERQSSPEMQLSPSGHVTYRTEKTGTPEHESLLSKSLGSVIEIEIPDPTEKKEIITVGITDQQSGTAGQSLLSQNIAADTGREKPAPEENIKLCELRIPNPQDETPEQKRFLSKNLAAVTEKETRVPEESEKTHQLGIRNKLNEKQEQYLLPQNKAAVTKTEAPVSGEDLKIRFTNPQAETPEQKSLLSKNVVAVIETETPVPGEDIKHCEFGITTSHADTPERKNPLHQNVAAVTKKETQVPVGSVKLRQLGITDQQIENLERGHLYQLSPSHHDTEAGTVGITGVTEKEIPVPTEKVKLEITDQRKYTIFEPHHTSVSDERVHISRHVDLDVLPVSEHTSSPDTRHQHNLEVKVFA